MNKPFQVFRGGAWIQYPLIHTQAHNELMGWQKKHEFQAASLYSTALSKGYSPLESNAFAEMYIFKQIHEGIQYDKRREAQLKELLS